MGSVRAARERLETKGSEQQAPVNPVLPLAGNGNTFAQAQQRGAPPQRPPRPNYVPTLSRDAGKQEPSTAYNQSQQPQAPPPIKYWEPNYMSGPLTPATTSSRDSAGSSVGSIPDFPVPALPAQTSQPAPRRTVYAGPPPTQRRGPSSYYSQASFVAPIPEEGIEMPQVAHDNWHEDRPDYLADRDSTFSAAGQHLVEPVGLVRNASMGKQYKPLLKTARPVSQQLQQQKGHAAPQLTEVDRSHLAAERTVFVESMDSDDELTSIYDDPSFENGTFLAAPSIGKQRKGSPTGEKEKLMSPKYAHEMRPVSPARIAAEKDDASSATDNLLLELPKPMTFEMKDEGSSRASLASLTDLVRRATRVRTNLEKGRTASRLGLRDFLSSSKPDLLKSPPPIKNEETRESLTDMLESFPPPAATPSRTTPTPTRDPPPQANRAIPDRTDRTDRADRADETEEQWKSPFTNTSGNIAQTRTQQQKQEALMYSTGGSYPSHYQRGAPVARRCCGLPLWAFILCMVLLLIFVVAAILIPIFLIVVPNTVNANASCSTSLPCANGGFSITSGSRCQCICAQGFTGSQCTQSPPVAADCATATFAPYQQVTIGTKVLPVVSNASHYSIPINSTMLLANFASSGLFCSDENSLVTFVNAGNSQKRSAPVARAVPVVAVPRAESTATSAGLVFDQPTATGTSSAPSATKTTPSSSQLGFAETAILYIFQQTGLDTANSMRKNLDTAFGNGAWLGPVITGTNVTVDLRLLQVMVGNTTVGTGA